MGERIWLLPEEGQFYKANLHCHTTLSDGEKTPEEIKELYRQQGYSVVAYTDHRRYVWHRCLMDETFIPLAAYEVNVDGAVPPDGDGSRKKTYHINLYDTDPEKRSREKRTSILPEHRYGDMAYINGWLADMRKMGFFACYNHPYWSMQTIEDYGGLKEVWAMEIYNHGCELEGMYGYNPQSYDEMLRAGTKLFCAATDDNHNLVPLEDPFSDSFGGFTMIKAERLTYEAVVSALLQGDFYASMGPKIRELYVEDNRLTVRTSPAEKIFVATEGRRCHRKIAEPGGVLTEAEFELTGKEGYIRVDVRDEKGRHANSNAYFLENGVPVKRKYDMENGSLV